MQVAFHDPQPETEAGRKKAVYVRSAYRNDPEFETHNLSRMGSALNERRLARLIDDDRAVTGNYQRLVSRGFEEVFESANGATTFDEFRVQIVGEIRDAMERLFPGLTLNSLGNPLTSGTFKFDKGESKAFLYKNLSGGEKAGFDLLLDMVIKRREFDDTVFFIDEPETHMGVRLQAALLTELLSLVPDNSQLWLATHSVGMMRRARELSEQNPGTVIFLDFDGRDFDAPQVLTPVSPDRPFWKRALQIALDDLADFVAPQSVFLCEGGHFDGGAREFDADCYNTIFQQEFPETVFIGAGNSNDVQNDQRGLTALIRVVSAGTKVRRLVDRDDMTSAEIAALHAQDVRVLSLRTVESYLLADETLRRLCDSLGRPELADDLLETKAKLLHDSVGRGNPADDMKSIAGAIFNAVKTLVPEQKFGSNARVFLKTFCAPLIAPGSEVYTDLRRDIFGA